MVAHIVLGVGLSAFMALGPLGHLEDGPGGDSLQKGIRLLEADDPFGKAGQDLQAEARRQRDAVEALARAVAARPDDPATRAWYALALLKTLKKDDALQSAEEAVRLGPEAAFAYRVRGMVHAAREEQDKALADLNEAVRLDPRDASNLRARGEFFADRHESERALVDYAAALKVDGRDARTYWLREAAHGGRQHRPRAEGLRRSDPHSAGPARGCGARGACFVCSRKTMRKWSTTWAQRLRRDLTR